MSAGFGYVNKTISGPYAITVSDQLDYEISFWFQQPSRQPTFELSVNCFDCQLSTELIPIDIQSGASQKVMIPGNLNICSLENRWNFFHSVLYASTQSIQPGLQPETSHAAGTNLIMQPGTAKLFVNLTVVKTCLLIWDFKVKPLRTEFSTGFIESNGLIEIWRKNNKKDLSAAQIDQLAEEFLITYDSAMIVTEL